MVVYKITNTFNGKIYIGKTVRSLALRWQEHLRAPSPSMMIGRAIKKYGAAMFTIEPLYETEDIVQLNQAEERLIQEYNSTNSERGYNLATGGDGALHTEQTRLKISQSCRGLKRTETTRQRIAASKKGTHLSPETRAKISNSKKGLGHPLYGKHHSSETIEKMRFSALARWSKR